MTDKIEMIKELAAHAADDLFSSVLHVYGIPTRKRLVDALEKIFTEAYVTMAQPTTESAALPLAVPEVLTGADARDISSRHNSPGGCNGTVLWHPARNFHSCSGCNSLWRLEGGGS